MPDKPGPEPRRASRKAVAIALAERVGAALGSCERISGGRAIRGSGGRHSGSVRACHVALSPGARGPAVKTCRARDTSFRRTSAQADS